MKVLVTGGAGFIGSQVTDSLIEKGYKVTVVDDLSTGKRTFINPKAKFYHLDIRDSRLKAVFSEERPDILCHYAAQASVQKSVEDPVHDADINIFGTLILLKLALSHGAKKCIFASTAGAIYGEQEAFPADETHPARPISPYGAAKLAAESYLYYYHAVYGLDYIVLRYASVYGPRQDSLAEAGMVATITEHMLGGKSPTVSGDGEQTRDFIFIDDAVAANLAAIDFSGSDIFNIGTGIETSINQLFQHIADLSGVRVEKTSVPAKKGEPRRSVISPEKAIKALHWQPKTSLPEGLRKTIEYFSSIRKET
ncbi:MAG: NAD-dependent epimerase/dehydratase family protein [bacterium]